MEIVIANRESVIEEIVNWSFVDAKPTISHLPRHTFAAFHDGALIAIAGFWLSESPVCELGAMATNPKTEASLRNEAINLLTDKILVTAKELGFIGIFARSKETTIVKRALDRGFSILPEVTFVRGL